MSSRARQLGLLTLLVLAAFTLRMINLERQPLHFDEAINVVFGSHAPWEALKISQDTFNNNPPAHRLNKVFS